MRNMLRKSRCLGLGLSVLAGALPGLAQQGAVEVEVLPVRDNVYMLVGGGGNVTVQTGEQGVLLVDAKLGNAAGPLLARVRELSDGELRYIVNTHYHGDHTGGNVEVKAAGSTIAGGNVGGDIADAAQGAQVIAHENVLLRMASGGGLQPEPAPSEAWPTLTYFTERKDLWFNGEGVRILHVPNAHTDGDSIVYFRRSDVIAAGDLYRTNGYPIIDVAAGGHINGIIEAANRIIELIIPVYGQDGGTLVIPGHGRLSDMGDVINWREMLTIIRDRIQHLVEQGMTLDEVRAARPTADYDPRWGSDSGIWTTDQFIEAVYTNLSQAGEQ